MRSNFPTNQIELLQILSNGGIATKVIIKDLKNDILGVLQILWEKTISQQELRFGLRVILGKLDIETDIEMAVMSIHRENINSYETTNEAVDIVEPNCNLFQDKIKEWQMLQNWNTDPETSE